MPKAKFAVQFYLKRTEDSVPSRYGKLHYYDFSILIDKEKKGKPFNTFRFENRSFMYLEKAVKSVTSKGEPIIEYVIDNSIPNNGKIITKCIEPIDGKLVQTEEEKKIASDLFDVVYARGEAKAVIAGSQKPKDELNMKSLIIGAIMGGFGGFVIGMLLYATHVLKA